MAGNSFQFRQLIPDLNHNDEFTEITQLKQDVLSAWEKKSVTSLKWVMWSGKKLLFSSSPNCAALHIGFVAGYKASAAVLKPVRHSKVLPGCSPSFSIYSLFLLLAYVNRLGCCCGPESWNA